MPVSRYMPLKAGTYHLSSPFGPRDRQMHWGQDFAANDGTHIYAAQAGSVQYIGAAQGFGQWIVIDHPAPAGGGTTVYGHMWDAFATGLKPGSSVTAGQHIAYVGSNGQSSGPHLHFEVHPTVWRAGSQIDPLPWLAGALDPETLLTVAAVPVTDTLYADVSEWQRPVDDSYPYRVIAIRSNDGTYRDKNWASNYAWCKRRCDENALVFFIVYFVWRQNWQQTVDTLKNLVGQPHPRMAVMIDVESWQGQIIGNQSDGLNNAYRAVADWLGDRRRVIAYGNRGDLNSLWPYKPVGLRIVLASYGSNPGYPGKIAHQYTNGEGYGGGLPEGCPPFGKCCMDSADGLTPEQYATACGIGAAVEGEPGGNDVFTNDDRVMLAAVYKLLLNTVPNRAAAVEAKPTKTARSRAKPARKTASQRAAKAGSSRAPRAAADGDQHD